MVGRDGVGQGLQAGLTVGRLGQVEAEQVVGFGAILPVAHDQLAAVPALEAVIFMQLLRLCFDFSSLLLQLSVFCLFFSCGRTCRLAGERGSRL